MKSLGSATLFFWLAALAANAAAARTDGAQPSLIQPTSDVTSNEVAADVSPLHFPAPAPAAVVAPPGPPLWIVVLREDAPLDDFLADHGISPRMVYRSINGFAAPLADTTRAVLRAQESLGNGGEKDINHKV